MQCRGEAIFFDQTGCSNKQAAGSRGLGMYVGGRVRVASAHGVCACVKCMLNWR